MTEEGQRLRWHRLLLAAVAMGIFAGAVHQAVRGVIGGEPWHWGLMALHVALWAVVWPPALWLVGRAVDRGRLPVNPSGAVRLRQSRLVRPALAAGVLPPDADPEVWRRALRAEVQEESGQKWLALVFGVLGAGLVGAAAVLANGNDPGVWLVAVVVAAGGGVVHRWSTRRLEIARRLLDDLARR